MGLLSRLKSWRENRKLLAMNRALAFGIGYELDKLGIPARILADAQEEPKAKMMAMPLPRSQREAAELATFSMEASLQLGLEDIALAVCQRPRIVFVDPSAIRRLMADDHARTFIAGVGASWSNLLFLLFRGGFRVARVAPEAQPHWIWVFEK